MKLWELLLLAAALATDAFAVSICKGLASKASYIKTGLACGIWFGFFQGLMPFLGWLLTATVSSYIENIAPYIAFALLLILGIKMIYEARKECACCEEQDEEELAKNASIAPRVMLAFAIATSIDALAAGVTFAATATNILLAVTLIAVVTFIFCFVGAAFGAKVGEKWKTGAELLGGVVIIALGIKILIEHLVTL